MKIIYQALLQKITILLKHFWKLVKWYPFIISIAKPEDWNFFFKKIYVNEYLHISHLFFWGGNLIELNELN